MKKASRETIRYLREVAQHYKALEEISPQPRLLSPPPKAPTPEVAMEVMALAAQAIAAILQYEKTGEIVVDPSPEFKLSAAEMIDREWSRRYGDD